MPSAWPKAVPHLERLGLLAYLAVLAIVLVKLAALRPLWYDELFTLHLARVGSLRDLLGHLAAGVDLNPPLTYIVTRFCVLAFGETEWALRLPAILGMLLGLTCFHAFLRQRLGFWPALLAVTVAVAPIKVWTFFLEARPYGLTFGFSALALYCWQRGVEPGARRRWLVGLGLAAMLGISTHYYFVLTLAAIGVAEITRWSVNRRVELMPMLALAMSGVALAAWYPLWSVAPRDFAAGFWAKVAFSRGTIEDTYLSFFEKSALLPLLVAIVVAALGRSSDRGGFATSSDASAKDVNKTSDLAKPRSDLQTINLPERIALVALLLGPVLGVALGTWVTGAFFYRYTLPAVLGFAGLFAVILHRTTATNIPIIFATLAFIGFGVTGNSKPYKEFFQYEKHLMMQTNAFLNPHCRGHRVIVESGFDFARAWHYDSGREYRPVFLADAEAAKHYNSVDTTERAVQLLKRVTPVPALISDEVVAALSAGETVFYYGPVTAWGYKDLVTRGVTFDAIAERNGVPLFKLKQR